MAEKKNTTLLVLFPNLTSKQDLIDRFNELLTDLHFEESGIRDDNLIAPGRYEYDTFSENIRYMVEAVEDIIHIKQLVF